MGYFLVDLICLFCVSLKVDVIWGINMNNKWMKFEMDEFLVNVCDFLSSAYDQEITSLLLLVHLLPPPPGGPKSSKISACDAVQRLVVFHKVIMSL